METRSVITAYSSDPVIVEPSEDGEIILRIGRAQPGETRYAVLSNSQALQIAANLIEAVGERLRVSN